ncbi:MAG: carboxymuconolactone decarboxylase family protein [Planctomycetota bacterium]
MKKTLTLFGTLLAGAAFAATTTGLVGPTAMETERGYPIHDLKSAPESTQEVLQWYVDNFQFVPNLPAIMAESPALSRSYWQVQKNLQEHGSLSQAEDNVVQMSIAVENRCQYCVAGHTMAGKMFFGSSDAELAAMRSGSKLQTPKLEALRTFALAVAEGSGRVDDAALQAFLDAGYTRKQSLDVVANIAAKVMSNYTNQLARTPLDPPFVPLAEGLPFAEKRGVVSVD